MGFRNAYIKNTFDPGDKDGIVREIPTNQIQTVSNAGFTVQWRDCQTTKPEPKMKTTYFYVSKV